MADERMTEASDALLARKEELARAVSDALYAEMPGLLEKYGEPGRAKCLQDMRYNLEHLAPAVALGEPALFARYAAWLRDMLAARGIPADEVLRSLELTERVVRHRLAPEQAEAVAGCIAAGVAALAEDG
jgi:hypothetical protein